MGGSLGLTAFQSRYVLPYALGVFAAVLVVGIIILTQCKAVIFRQVKADQINSARAGALALTSVIDNSTKTLELLAVSGAIRSGTYSQMKEGLESRVENFPLLKSIYIFTMSSSLITSAGNDSGVAGSLANDTCIDRIRSGVQTCTSGVYRTEAGERRVFVFVPFFSRSGEMKGVMAGGLDLENKTIQSIVQSINPSERGFSFITDNYGKLVISGEPSKEEQAIKDFSALEVVKEALNGKMGSIKYRYRDTSMLASFCPIESMGWVFVVQRPMADITSLTTDVITLLIVFLLLTTVAAGALALFQSQNSTRFFHSITLRMNEIAEGHRGRDIRGDEAYGFNSVADTYNNMVYAIDKAVIDKDRLVDEVSNSVKFTENILSSILDAFVVVDRSLRVVRANERAGQFVAGETPLTGQSLIGLEGPWGQPEIENVVRKALTSRQQEKAFNVWMSPTEGDSPVIFDFSVYPLGDGPDGAVIYGTEVGEYVNRHEKLLQSEKFHRELCTSVSDPAVLINSSLIVEWCNHPAVSILGLGDRPLIGTEFLDYVTDRCLDQMKTLLENATGGNDMPPQITEIEIQPHRQKPVAVEISLGTIHSLGADRHKYILTMREVPAIRLFERDAYANKAKLENRIRFLTAAIDSTPEPIAIVSGESQIIMVNTAFAEMFGERKEVFIGKNFDILHATPDKLFNFEQVAKTGTVSRETNVRPLRGTPFQALVKCTVSNSAGTSAYIISVRETGTEKRARMTENRLLESRTRTRMARTLSIRFETIADELGDALKELGGMLFANETRSVWGHAVEYCRELRHAANTLNLYSTETQVTLYSCHIEDIMDEVIGQLERTALIPPNISLEWNIQKHTPPVNADPDLLKLIVWHVIKNAAEAASGNPDSGEVAIHAFPSESDGVPVLMLDVFDNGPDFDPYDGERFFEPFYGTKRSGMGLGLTLARRAAIRHNGRMSVQRMEKVTRVSCYIPYNLTPERVGR